MDWSALSAIGTLLAAFVGIVGIWLNLFDKKKRLRVSFDSTIKLYLYVNNDSLRSVIITKMEFCVNGSIFYVKRFNGTREMNLGPASVQSVELDGEEIYDAYHTLYKGSSRKAKRNVIIILYDSLGRKHKVNTRMSIASFQLH